MLRDLREVSAETETVFDDFQASVRLGQGKLRSPGVEDLAKSVIARLASRKPSAAVPDAACIARFCDALIDSDEDAAADFIAGLRRAGIGHTDLTAVYFAEAARMLGTWWEDDRISFFQTTLGTCRLIGLLRALQPEDPVVLAAPGRNALFTTLPDEGHTIGITIAADLFRRNGWDVDLRMQATTDNLVAAVRANAPPIVCICASARRAVPPLKQRIAALTRLPQRPHCFVAGIITQLCPEVADLVGADGALTDITSSLDNLGRLATRHSPAPRQGA